MGSGLFVEAMNANRKFTVKWYNLVCTAILYLRLNGISGIMFSLYFLPCSLQNWNFCDPTPTAHPSVNPSQSSQMSWSYLHTFFQRGRCAMDDSLLPKV